MRTRCKIAEMITTCGKHILIYIFFTLNIAKASVYTENIFPDYDVILQESIDKNLGKDTHLLSLVLAGEKFSCRIPIPVDNSKVKGDSNDQFYTLGKLANKCINKSDNFWSYSICFEDTIFQYNLKSRLGFSLGKYSNSYTIRKTVRTFYRNVEEVRIVQRYTNGSNCALTSQPRETEIHFICNRYISSVVAQVEEINMCSYRIYIWSKQACSKVDERSSKIICTPLSPLNLTRMFQHKKGIKSSDTYTNLKINQLNEQRAESSPIQTKTAFEAHELLRLSSGIDISERASNNEIDSDDIINFVTKGKVLFLIKNFLHLKLEALMDQFTEENIKEEDLEEFYKFLQEKMFQDVVDLVKKEYKTRKKENERLK